MELAEKREESHPGDSLGIYRRMIEPVIDRTKADAYREAVRLLRRVHHLMSTLDRKHEFQEYVESLRSAYRRKRNFIRLLDAEDWG